MKRKGPVTKLKEALEEKNNEIKELKDKYLRVLAELDNYRKRVEKEVADRKKFAIVEFFMKVIPVLDSFDRAMSGVELNNDFENFYKGVEIIHRQLREALRSLGLVEFSGLNETFDPSRHEAVATVETDDKPENTVIEEISKGYMIDNRVIKPAKVFVSKQKEGEEGGQEDAKNNRD
jgi:molecular chaperone GrpE